MAGSSEQDTQNAAYNRAQALSSRLAAIEGGARIGASAITFRQNPLPFPRDTSPLERRERYDTLAIAAIWDNKKVFNRIIEETFPGQLSQEKKDRIFNDMRLTYFKELGSSLQGECLVAARDGNPEALSFWLYQLHADFSRRVGLGERDNSGYSVTTGSLQREALITMGREINNSLGNPDMAGRERLLRGALDNPNFSSDAVYGAAAELGINLRR